MIRLAFALLLLAFPALAGDYNEWKAPTPRRTDRLQSCVTYHDYGLRKSICLDPFVMELFDLHPGEEISIYEAARIKEWKRKALLR